MMPGGVLEQRLLEAYLDIHDQAGEKHLRLGRQYLSVADGLLFDGGQAILFENTDFGGRVFFGVPVSYYPSYFTSYYPASFVSTYVPVYTNLYTVGSNRYTSAANRLVGGLSLVGKPWDGNQTRFTYIQYSDDNGHLIDHTFLLESWQRITDGVDLHGRVSFLNDSFRMAGLDLACFTPQGDTTLFVGGSRWGAYDAETVAYAPLVQQLGTAQPYTYLYARASQVLSPSWTISPGISARLTDGGDPKYSNRSDLDYDVTLSYAPTRSFGTSLSAQYLDMASGDNYLGLNGEVCFQKPRSWEVALGCAYAAYSYSDLSYAFNSGGTWLDSLGTGFLITENGTVRTTTPYALTYYTRAKWYATRNLIFRLQCSVEDDKTASTLGFQGRASAEVNF